MIKEIYFVHHSHTDIGYTHPQPVVLELHRRFIEEALDIAEATAGYDDESRFKWTCEVTGVTEEWWKRADNRNRDRFLAAVKRGQFEVAGMSWHMTPLMDHNMVVDVLKPVKFFRELGIPVRSAMNTDVNGLPWGVVDALLDHGITGISMAVNEHFGHNLAPWPRAFRWQSPEGRTITAYNGFIYGVTSDLQMAVPVDFEAAQKKVPAWTALWESRGYPHDFLMMQITNVRYHDNGSPQPALPDFIRRFNATNPPVRLRFVTLSQFFDRMRAEPENLLPVRRGDWTDWWNFGAGSTAHETAQSARGQRDLDDAMSLASWRGDKALRYEEHLDEARRALALYAEHTWGADRSVWYFGSPETRTQQLLKLVQAPQGASLARMLRRDGLEALAADAGGEEPRVLMYNPHPTAVKRSLRLPYLPPLAGAPAPGRILGIEEFVPHGPSSHRIQRQDVHITDLPDDRAYWSEAVEVPPLSYVTMPAADLEPAPTDALSAEDGALSNGLVTLKLDPVSGALTSLQREGVEYAGNGRGGLAFGVPVLEVVVAGTRDAIFDRIQVESPDWHEAWHKDWQAERTAAKLDGAPEAVVDRGRAQIAQRFVLPNGDKLRVTYRLVPGDAAVELEVVLDKQPIAAPHALYLPLPTSFDAGWDCHFETGGAAVRLDDEQLPYASRHYITAQRWIRIADGARELAVACPDAPLWQVGGFTYGRFQDPDGRVTRENPTLLAWLTNNYWMTNFQADQGGETRFTFSLLPGPRQSLAASAQKAVTYARPPVAHVYAGRGPVRREAGSLLALDLGSLLLTRVEREGNTIGLTVLNAEDAPVPARIGAGLLTPLSATRTGLGGEPIEPLPLDGGAVRAAIAPRAWTRIAIEVR
ncbi:MAG TPA: hypothetical protein VHB23_03715 [Devosiaceae bacterium]|nr:hypothetical protein [Devosiaceae bacterium]